MSLKFLSLAIITWLASLVLTPSAVTANVLTANVVVAFVPVVAQSASTRSKPAAAFTKPASLQDYRLSASFFGPLGLSVVAEDRLGNDATTTGRLMFSINGVEKSLRFYNGRARFPDSLTSSTFLYLKPKSGAAKAKLYYAVQAGGRIVPVKVSSWWLIGVPLFFMFVGLIFRKLIGIVIIVAVLFFLLNKGLDLSTYFTVIKDKLATLVREVW